MRVSVSIGSQWGAAATVRGFTTLRAAAGRMGGGDLSVLA